MIKVEVIKDFDFAKFDEIKETLIRKKRNKTKYGKLFIGDVFKCDEETADYLTGNNPKKIEVVKVIEVMPDIQRINKKLENEDIKAEIKSEKPTTKKTRKRKISKK